MLLIQVQRFLALQATDKRRFAEEEADGEAFLWIDSSNLRNVSGYYLFMQLIPKKITILYLRSNYYRFQIPMNEKKYFDYNQKLWDDRVESHKNSKFYNVKGFKAGKTSLNAAELNEIGDVLGKSLLHLQCHFGMDTMSFSRMGAKATGMDFSEQAMHTAKDMAEELNLDTKFVCANVYDLKSHIDGPFDIVFTSYGTVGWLPDLTRWAEIISYYLAKGGFFYMIDFHPVLWMLDTTNFDIQYSYFNTGPIREEVQGSYANRNHEDIAIEYGWNHSLSEIVNALITAGLQIEFLNEFPYSSYNVFKDMEQGKPGQWRFKQHGNKLPMMYSIKAGKPM
jgi:ubiquinone/menaquinone biosynthesis C-methylase UbiE